MPVLESLPQIEKLLENPAIENWFTCISRPLAAKIYSDTVIHYLKAGAGLVSFSGDKVLGGPQAGLIAGEQSLISKLASHPLLRVFRPGKTK